MVQEGLKITEVLIREPWDCFIVHFYATDVVQHAFWRFIDPDHPQYDERNASEYGMGPLEIFSEVDLAIGKILESVNLDETTVLVISDHGFGPNYCTININQWLQKIGMLKLHPPLAHTGRRAIGMLVRKMGLPLHSSVARLLRVGASMPGYLLPVAWQHTLLRLSRHALCRFPLWSSLLNMKSYATMFEAVDWKKTRAYSIGTCGLIHINLKRHLPQGIVVSGKEYKQVRNRIITQLLNLRDKKGRQLIDRVYRKEEIYHGKFLNEAPDLIIQTETMGCYFYPFLDREGIVTDAESFRSGNHRIEGIFIANGPIVRKSETPLVVQMIDMAPIILYLLDTPILQHMDGVVNETIIDPQYLKEHPIRKVEEPDTLMEDHQILSLEDERRIAKRLEELGYL
jgi:predicted AlkP superfamily phosphohydrolase/phosphomutase